MELVKEPLEIDFVVDSRPLTKQEKLAISEFIKADKSKRLISEKALLMKKPSENAKKAI